MNVPTFRQIASVASGFILGAAIGFIFGTAIGLWGVRVGSMHAGMINSMAANVGFSNRAQNQYCNGDYDGARAALLAWLRHLDAEALSDSPQWHQDALMSPRLVAGDKTIALGRLALLEERHGDSSRANEYWRQAGISAQVAQWKDYSEAKLRTFVDHPTYCNGRKQQPVPKPGA